VEGTFYGPLEHNYSVDWLFDSTFEAFSWRLGYRKLLVLFHIHISRPSFHASNHYAAALWVKSVLNLLLSSATAFLPREDP
jgi:hypothetical protein